MENCSKKKGFDWAGALFCLIIIFFPIWKANFILIMWVILRDFLDEQILESTWCGVLSGKCYWWKGLKFNLKHVDRTEANMGKCQENGIFRPM